MVTTERLRPDAPGIERAAALLARGALVAFPTETVYGLGADARSPEAVAAIYAAKGRPSSNPLIVHVPDLAAARALAEFDPDAEALARALWPGPLTLVLPRRPEAPLAPAVSAGRPTLALRVPRHPVAEQLLRRFGAPVAAPSANRSGRISPTRPEHVLEELGGRIAAVIEAGPAPVGLESTIVATGPGGPRLLRAGAITPEQIAEVLGRSPVAATEAGAGGPEAPGQLTSHYAPAAPLRLNVTRPAPDELWIGFGPGCAGASLTLSARGDPAEAAARLYAVLREADREVRRRGLRGIAVAPVPAEGLGLAINDRLRRAAAPRG